MPGPGVPAPRGGGACSRGVPGPRGVGLVPGGVPAPGGWYPSMH